MSGCWSEGELRACLDGELPARDMEAVAAHLKECAACGGVYRELAARAVRVGAMLDSLPHAKPLIRPRPRRAKRWIVAGGAIAAATILALLAMPRRAPVSHPVPPRRALALSAPKQAAAVPTRAEQLRQLQQPRPLRRTPRPVRIDSFLALDDEPIETGIVVRINLAAGPNGSEVPADVILGPDGRPHAIRLVNGISGEQQR